MGFLAIAMKVQVLPPSVEVGDLHATILAAVGIDYTKVLQTPNGRTMKLAEGKPVKALL